MALECAHCGTRVADGTVRCPQCLRSTALVEIPTAPPRASFGRGRWIAGVVALALVAGGGVYLAMKRADRASDVRESPIARSLRAGGEAPDPFAAHGTTSVWTAQVRSGNGDVVRARSVMDLVVASLQHARLVDDPHDAPPARSIDDVARALAAADGRVTSLDVARLMVSILRDAGVQHADVAEQLGTPRPGDPPDPSALLGRYVAVVGDMAIDLTGRTVIAARELHAQPLASDALLGAMLAQSALHAIHTDTRRDRALALADSAVNAWRDGVVPLAVRAEAWRAAGSTGGLGLAEQDLASAVALRDGDAAIHLLRARFALMGGRGDLVDAEIRAALSRARTFGPAALAAAIAGTEAVDGGDRCAALNDAHGEWTTTAWTICRGGGAGALDARDAAQRLIGNSTDPMVLAYGAASGAEGALARVRSDERDEYAAWLVAMGRRDLAAITLGLVDAGR